MNKIMQKKVDLNVILTVLSEIQFGNQGGGTRENLHFRGTTNLFGIFFKYVKIKKSPS